MPASVAVDKTCNNMSHMVVFFVCVCVCASASVCVCACVRACVRACVWVRSVEGIGCSLAWYPRSQQSIDSPRVSSISL